MANLALIVCIHLESLQSLRKILTDPMHVKAPTASERIETPPGPASDSQSPWFMIENWCMFSSQSVLRSWDVLSVCCKGLGLYLTAGICSWECHMRQIDRPSPCWRGATGTKKTYEDMTWNLIFKYAQCNII